MSAGPVTGLLTGKPRPGIATRPLPRMSVGGAATDQPMSMAAEFAVRPKLPSEKNRPGPSPPALVGRGSRGATNDGSPEMLPPGSGTVPDWPGTYGRPRPTVSSATEATFAPLLKKRLFASPILPVAVVVIADPARLTLARFC